MDQYTSTIIVAIITGVFSVLAIIIQKRQDKTLKKIDEQTVFIEKERALKQRIDDKAAEIESIVDDIMVLILDTNVSILRSVASELVDPKVFDECERLKKEFGVCREELIGLRKEHKIVLDMASQFVQEIEKTRNGK